MSRIIQPVVSPTGRVILLTGATLWLVAAMLLSAVPEGVDATPNRAVELIDSRASFTIERIDGTDELLYRPNVVADPSGALFVADYGSHRVIRLGENLEAAAIFGQEGFGPGEMQIPYGVAADSQGNVYIADQQLGRINKFDASGEFIKSVAAPRAAQIIIDSHDELIVYPTPGPALMRRYSSDLEAGEELLTETDDRLHHTRMGVLIGIDRSDHVFVLDQADLLLSVYDRDMRLLTSWPVNGDELHESIALRVAKMQAKNPDDTVRVPGFQAMAVDPRGDHIAFAYIVRRPEGDSFTRVVWYGTDGEFIGSQDRSNEVFASALLPDGRLIEGTVESLVLFTADTTATTSRRGN